MVAGTLIAIMADSKGLEDVPEGEFPLQKPKLGALQKCSDSELCPRVNIENLSGC